VEQAVQRAARDTALPKRALILLADADAFRSIGLDRRAALWAVRRLPDDVPLPLFEIATAREQPDENAQPLPDMPLPEQVVAEIEAPDTDADEAATPAPAPIPKVKAPIPQPVAARPASGQKAGGLRGMFSMPPPPEFNGGGSAAGANTELARRPT